MRFKRGDRVRCICDNRHGGKLALDHGKVYTVLHVKIDKEQYYIKVEELMESHPEHSYMESRFIKAHSIQVDEGLFDL